MVVTGRVQGVGFRDWTVEAARALGLAGWVRNRRDGAVELHAAGDPAALDALDALAAACRGRPPSARVARVAVTDAADEPLAGFARRPTA